MEFLYRGHILKISPEDLPLFESYTWQVDRYVYTKVWDKESGKDYKKYLHRLIIQPPPKINKGKI